MDLKLAGKTAIVTGGGRGIGRGIALRLASEGAHVVVNFTQNDAAAAEVVTMIEANGGKAVAAQADVGDYAQAETLIEKTNSAFGTVDILVNNAGIVSRKGILEVPIEEWDRVLRTNLYGTFYCSRLAAQQMVDQGTPGRIVSISSIHGEAAKSHMGSYSASKGAINLFSKQLAVELAPHGIGVNVVASGTIRTEINEPLYQSTDPKDVALQNAVRRRVPLGYIGEPDDIATAVCFLSSAECARYITGAVLFVDGGYVADGTPRL